MSETQKCCICLPIDIGMKMLAGLIMLSTTISVINATFIEEDGWSFYWHLLSIQLIVTIFWIIALVKPSLETKKAIFWAYLVLITLGANIIYSYLILSGKLASHLCNTQVEHESVDSMANCERISQDMLLIDCMLSWVVNPYFSWVIWKWAELEAVDEYKLV